jgi:2-desacetyl-2-hydroxyethyl bacteriochlorophyllide A dehydrogenase
LNQKLLQIVAPEPGQLTLQTAEPPPSPGPGEVQVASLYTAISPGTELAWLHGGPGTPGKFPLKLGYTGVGRVIATGPSVHRLHPGDHVAGKLKHASIQNLPETGCHDLPDTLDPAPASMFRLAAIGLQAIHHADAGLGISAAVIGLGPIGLTAGQWLRIAGAQRVVGVDRIAARRDIARACGLDAVTDQVDDLPTESLDVVIDATGVPAVVVQAMTRVRDLGQLVLLGSPRGTINEVDFYRDVHRRGVQLRGAHVRLRPGAPLDAQGNAAPGTHEQDEAMSLAYAASGRLQLKPMLSRTVQPADAPDAYRDLEQGDGSTVGVVIDWRHTA